MKEKIFHFFGNIIEQTPIPTPIKLAVAFRLELIIFIFAHIATGVIRKTGEKRISQEFITYFYENKINQNKEKIELLKRGLDNHSMLLIDKIIQRQIYVFTHNILDLKLLTANERKNQYINFYSIKTKYRGLGNYYGIENFYFHCGLRFISKKLLKKYEQKDVLDIGAANGDTPAIFSKEYSFRNIFAFEPEENNYQELLKNIKKFKLKNVIPIKKGIGNKKTKLKIRSQEGQSYITSAGNQIIDVTTIDNFVKDNNLNVGLIKMDIEGFEFFAIMGTLKTIKKHHPILLISIYHCGRDFFEIKPLLEKIGGYKFMIRKLNPHHFFFDTMLIGIPI